MVTAEHMCLHYRLCINSKLTLESLNWPECLSSRSHCSLSKELKHISTILISSPCTSFLSVSFFPRLLINTHHFSASFFFFFTIVFTNCRKILLACLNSAIERIIGLQHVEDFSSPKCDALSPDLRQVGILVVPVFHILIKHGSSDICNLMLISPFDIYIGTAST